MTRTWFESSGLDNRRLNHYTRTGLEIAVSTEEILSWGKQGPRFRKTLVFGDIPAIHILSSDSVNSSTKLRGGDIRALTPVLPLGMASNELQVRCNDPRDRESRAHQIRIVYEFRKSIDACHCYADRSIDNAVLQNRAQSDHLNYILQPDIFL